MGQEICKAYLRPVGQGCFYTATIFHNPDAPFQLVYDCGSLTGKGCLEPQISEFRRHVVGDRRTIDMLVISHLDADHVNGLKELMKGLITKHVFLPYFTPIERLLCALRFLGDADESYFDFLSDPAKFLINNGAETVVYVTNGDRPDGSEAGNASDGSPPQPAIDDKSQLPLDVITVDIKDIDKDEYPEIAEEYERLKKEQNTKKQKAQVKTMVDSVPAKLSGFWRFKFFHKNPTFSKDLRRLKGFISKGGCRPSNEDKMTFDFLKKVQAVVKGVPVKGKPVTGGLEAKDIVDVIQSAGTKPKGGKPKEPPKSKTLTQLAQLKEHYKLVDSKHNDVSLVLWHGPVLHNENNQNKIDGFPVCWQRHRSYFCACRVTDCERSEGAAGTLLTGDLTLLDLGPVKNTVSEFKKHFAGEITETAFFYVPHHGSHNSWNYRDAIFLDAPNPWFMTSAGTQNQWKHPHQDVVKDHCAAGRPIFWSNEDIGVILRTFKLT